MKKMFISVIALAMSMMAMATEEAFVRIRFNGASGGESVVRLYQDDANTPEYESSFDSDKMLEQSNSKSVLIYGIVGTHKCEDVVTNNLQGVEIGFVTNNVDAANYKFTFENPRGLALQLYDRVEDKLLDMTNNATYTFDAAAGRVEINNRFVIGAPAIAIKGTGDWYNVGKDVDLVSTDGGLTATGSITFDADDLNVNYGYYNFNFVRGIKWLSNGSEFSREAASGVITGTNTDNMWFHLDVAGEYTFTWTYADDKLEIGFPTAPVAVASVTTNEDGWASFAYTADVAPADPSLAVYKGALNNSDPENPAIVLTAVTTGIPAGEGVFVHGEPLTTYYFSATTATAFTGNDLVGCTVATDPAGISDAIYTLRNVGGTTALYHYVGTAAIPAGKAYLPIAVSGSNPAPARVRMVINGAQGIEKVQGDNVPCTKFVENGQVFIRRGNEVYNLQGQIVK